jgi:hypothetical protein
MKVYNKYKENKIMINAAHQAYFEALPEHNIEKKTI